MRFTDWLAVYAATLSTLTFLLNWRASRPHMRVELMPGMMSGTDAVCIVITNPSGKTLHLQAVGLVYPTRRPSLLGLVRDTLRYRRWTRWWGWCHSGAAGADTRVPTTVEAYAAHKVFVPKADVEKLLEHATQKRFAAYAQDALGRNKYSNILDGKWL